MVATSSGGALANLIWVVETSDGARVAGDTIEVPAFAQRFEVGRVDVNTGTYRFSVSAGEGRNHSINASVGDSTISWEILISPDRISSSFGTY